MANVHEHIAAGTSTVVSLALPFNITDWLMHIGTSVLAGIITWAVTHVLKAIWKQIR